MDPEEHPLLAGLGVLAVIGVIASLFTFMIGHPFQKTPADKIALSYGGGPFEGAKYQKTVLPGSGLVFNGVFDKWYEYPITTRNYIVSTNPAEGDRANQDKITAPTKDGVSVDWELAVNFKLNTNDVRDFHQKLGLKFQAWTAKGWDQLLDQQFRQPLESAVQRTSRQFSSEEVYKDAGVYQKIQDTIAAGLKESINASVGEEFFCGPSFQLGQPACPPFQVVLKHAGLPKTVIDAFNSQKETQAGIEVAKNQAQAKVELAKGDAASQAASQQSLTPEYLEKLRIAAEQTCASNPGCTLVITNGGTGTNVNIPTK